MTWSDGDLLTPTNLNDISKGSDTVTVTGDNSTRSTKASAVQNAIDRATNQGKAFVFVPESFTNYDASAVTFDNSVRMVREGNLSDVYDVKAYGAAGDGTIDDSIACNEAIAGANSQGGSVVWFPESIYRVEGLNIREGIHYVGASSLSSHLRLPDSPSDHLFRAPAGSSNFNNEATFQNLHLNGGDASTASGTIPSHNFDGINFSNVSQLRARIVNCFIRQFRHGYHGSNSSDRYVPIYGTRVWYCDVGIYIDEDHPRVATCDIRRCNIGIGGGSIYDALILNNKITPHNEWGINPDEGDVASMQNTVLVNNSIGGSDNGQIRAGNRNIIVGNYIRGSDTSGATPDGIVIAGNWTSVVGNMFDADAGDSMDRVIVVEGAISTFNGCNIQDNQFILNREAAPTVVIEFEDEKIHLGHSIRGNTFRIDDAPVVRFEGTTQNFDLGRIEGNYLRWDGDSGTSDLFHIGATSRGYNFLGNVIRSTGTAGDALGGDGANSIIKNNRIEGDSGSTISVTTNSSTIIADNIVST